MTNNHILVPIDFSNESLRVLEFSIQLAKILSVGIKLIHVKQEAVEYNLLCEVDDFSEVLNCKVNTNFEKLLGKVSLKHTIDINCLVREGRIYTEVCNQAKYGDSFFIVMGTHGVPGFKERWGGSNAYRVASHAFCPTLTMRYDFPMRQINNIVLPIDESEQSCQKVPFVVTMAKKLKAYIFVLGLYGTKRTSSKQKIERCVIQVESYIKRRGVNFGVEYLRSKNQALTSLEFGLYNNADLIAIMLDQKDSVPRLLKTHCAQQTINHSPIPILSFRPY